MTNSETQQAADLLLEFCLKAPWGEDESNFENSLILMSPEMASVMRIAKPLVTCSAKYVIKKHGDRANEILAVCCEKNYCADQADPGEIAGAR